MSTIPLNEAIEIVKDPWRRGDEDTAYIGLEHIGENTLALADIGRSANLESNKFRFRKGDVLFGKLRPYFRKVVRPDFDGVCSTDIWVMRAKDGFDQSYVFYFVANPEFVAKSSGASTGTKMPRADWGFLGETEWEFPPLDEQRSIAAVLSSLDEKIELLRRQNETLEQIAQAIFNEWFVKPTIDGALPEGWRMGTLADIATIDWGNTNLTKSAYVADGEYLGVSAAGGDGRMAHAEHEVGTTVLSAIGEYAGRTFYPTESFTAIKNTITVSPIAGVSTGWFIHHLLSVNTIPRRGAAQPFLSKGDTQAYAVAIPAFTDVTNADALFSAMENKQKNNTASVKTLSEIRDALLPRLMSGDLRVNN